MQKSYRYKLKPNARQKQLLAMAFGCARYVYNWGLDIKIKSYQSEKKNVSYNELSKMLTLLRKEEGKEWFADVNSTFLQQSLRNLEAAFSNFFRRCKNKTGIGFPEFKSKHRCNNSVKYIGSGCRF